MNINNIIINLRKFIPFFIIFSLIIMTGEIHAQSGKTDHFPYKELSDNSVSLLYQDTITLLSSMDFDLPVKMRPGTDISAITIGFYYPHEYLEITGLELADSTTGFYSNISDSSFILSWSDILPIVISENDTILVIKMKTLDLSGLVGTIKLELYESTEFADQNANIIEGVELEIPEIAYFKPDTIDTITGYYVHVYPNPFDDYATVYFGLKEESRVSISVYNPEGMMITDFGENAYPEGDHQERIYGSDLAKGVYFLKFEIRNSEKSSKELFKIMSIR